MAEKTTSAAVLAADSPELHALLAHPLRHEIAMRMAARPWCCTELAEATGEPPKRVSRAVETLKKHGVVELVEKRTGDRGGWSYFYRACRSILDAEEWERLTDADQLSLTGKRLAELQSDQAAALEAGTFHSHPRHVLLRDHRHLDDAGMRRQDEILNRAYEEIIEAERESVERCAARGDRPHRVVIGLTTFVAAPEALQ